ncbi:MAG: CBS domain-containing protein [Clostridia bacterium]|nr:CBS domain-containing protein [Clostridia bacterium]
MQAKDFMTRKVITISQDETVATAARLLARYNIGALPVVSREGKLRGMVTDRDVVLRCVAHDEDPHEIKISEIMSRRIISVSPEESADLCAEKMAEAQIRRLPVEQNGKLVGMISLGDMAKAPDYSMEAAKALTEISVNIRRK